MDIEQVKTELNQKFSMPLPEFYSRRIVFWYDEDKDFEDKLDQIHLDNVELLVLTGSNNFEAKKILTRDKPDTNFLVYCPMATPAPDDDWLLDIKLYSEEFRADLTSILMRELGLTNFNSLRKTINENNKFFKSKDRRTKFKRFATPTTRRSLILTIMAALTGAKEAQPSEIIQAVINKGLDLQKNTAYQALVSYQLDAKFATLVKLTTGYEEADFSLEDTEELLDEGDTSSNTDKKDESQETKDKKFSFSGFLENVKDKVDDAIDTEGEVTTEKLSAFEDGLNRILEGVAVLIVTTCAIPVLVMLSFTWILKGIMGLRIPSVTLQSVPRVSERKRKKSEEN